MHIPVAISESAGLFIQLRYDLIPPDNLPENILYRFEIIELSITLSISSQLKTTRILIALVRLKVTVGFNLNVLDVVSIALSF